MKRHLALDASFLDYSMLDLTYYYTTQLQGNEHSRVTCEFHLCHS